MAKKRLKLAHFVGYCFVLQCFNGNLSLLDFLMQKKQNIAKADFRNLISSNHLVRLIF